MIQKAIDSGHVEELRKAYSGPMSEEEVEILHDIEAFIAFAIRNGLSFPMVVGTLGHDINGLARTGFDLAAMRAAGVQAKVTRYRHTTPDDFGDSDDQSE